jgi:hypothetical protein
MKMKLFFAITIGFIIISLPYLCAQPRVSGDNKTTPSPSPSPAIETLTSFKAFRGIEIGMSLEQVKEILKKDAYFNYRGDPDVYFLPVKEQLLIECDGNVFIKRAYFQFVDKKLLCMIIDLDENKVDYFSLLTTLNNNYGNYQSFSPQLIVWEKNGLRLSLEKPLTVKYIDLAVFRRLKEAGKAAETEEEKTLKDFLGQF